MGDEHAVAMETSGLTTTKPIITPSSRSSLFSTASGHQIELNEDQMNRGRAILTELTSSNDASSHPLPNQTDSIQTESSFFGTASGRSISISAARLEQASSLLASLAEQADHSIVSTHTLPAPPDRETSPLKNTLESERTRIEVPVNIEGPVPLKPQLPDPDRPLLHSVNRERANPLSRLPPISSSKRGTQASAENSNRKRFHPVFIQNDSTVYGPSSSDSDHQKASSEEVIRCYMEQYQYRLDLHTYELTNTTMKAFHSLEKRFGYPYCQEYKQLYERLKEAVDTQELVLQASDPLQSADMNITLTRLEYEENTSFKKEKEEAGVLSLILQVDNRNAEFVLYPESPNSDSLPTGFHTDPDSTSPQFQRILEWMVADGADRNLLSKQWIRCMWRNIIWKQSSKCKWQGVNDPLKFCTVIQLLSWRYITECYLAKPPPIKRLVQRDENEGRLIVLLVSDILFIPPVPDYDDIPEPGEKTTSEKEKNLPGRIELTDGWYFIEAVLDPSLTHLLQIHRIYPGLKLRIACAKMIDNTNGCSPLEMKLNSPRIAHSTFFPSYQTTNSQFSRISPTPIEYEGANDTNPRLVLQYNNTRRAVWNSYLGFTNLSVFNVNPNDCVNEGGTLPQTDLLITRKYGLRFIERIGDTTISRTEEEEEKVREEWERTKHELYSSVLQMLSSRWEKEPFEEEENPPLSEDELNRQQDYKRQRMEERRKREIEEAMEEAMDKADFHDRDVSIVGCLQVISPYRYSSSCLPSNTPLIDVSSLCLQTGLSVDPVIGSHHHIYDSITVTLWNTSLELYESLIEGNIYRVTMLQARNPSRQKNSLYLSSSNSTRWDDITEKYKAEYAQHPTFDYQRILNFWTPRHVKSLSELATYTSKDSLSRYCCDVVLVFLIRSELKKREITNGEQEEQGFYDVCLCDLCGNVMVLMVPERYSSVFVNLSLGCVCYLRDILFRGTDRVLDFLRGEFGMHSRLVTALHSSINAETRLWIAVVKDSIKKPIMETALLAVRTEIRLLLNGDLPPASHQARLKVRLMAVGFFVGEGRRKNHPLLLSFSKELLLAERQRKSYYGSGKRKSIGGNDEKRRKLNSGLSEVSVLNTSNSSILSEKEQEIQEDTNHYRIHEYFLSKGCSWEDIEVEYQFCDLTRGSIVTPVLIRMSLLNPILQRVCEGDSRNGWNLMNTICSALETLGLNEFHGFEFGRQSSPETATELLMCLLLHSSGARCTCGIYFDWTEEQRQAIQNAWCIASKDVICIVRLREESSSDGVAVIDTIDVV